MDDDVEKRAVNLEAAIVFDEPELSELVHEKVDAGARSSDAGGENLLINVRNGLELAFFADRGQQEEDARETLLAGIE